MKSSLSKIRKNSGFTLLELMVAMVIFSFMSIMAYSALANIFKSNEVITEQEVKLKSLQRSMMFIERDLRQLVLRSRSSGYGELPSPALDSGLDSEGVVEFTRAGNSNPTELLRSSLQRIRYVVEDSKLSRLSWNLVDHIDAEPVKMLLLEDIDSLDFKFLDNKNNWQENWASLTEIPRAIELTLEHKNWGKIVRLFSIQ
ncbi:MAG: type II secretion system minor pseudopilin GspJ [Thiotrichaceae bacterium]|nr:type II secretion system minor pseudopilin GspJ [Thiotrichaceae bacterium]